MARILLLNNYALEPLLPEVRAGRVPDNLLYGAVQIAAAGHELVYVPHAQSRALRQLSRWLPRCVPLLRLGDLDQQRSCLRLLSNADVIYAPCQTQTPALALLRALGLLKTPIIALAHHPLDQGRLERLRRPLLQSMLQGIDAFPSLSRFVAAQINRQAPGKSEPLVWGPPRGFFPAAVRGGLGIVSAGRTARDFVTLGKAASLTSTAVHIVCLKDAITEEFATFASNVEVTARPNDSFLPYPELVKLYATARAIAIPLQFDSHSLAGLTSLADAVAMGKPVIMTRHPMIDLDIEAEGIGFWVEPGDVESWRDRIEFLDAHPRAAEEMGQRAVDLVAAGWNSDTFAQQILRIINGVLS